MPVPSANDPGDATVALDMVAIKHRAADILEIPFREVTDQMVADLLKTSRKSVGRWKAGTEPRLGRAIAMGERLEMTLDEITGRTA